MIENLASYRNSFKDIDPHNVDVEQVAKIIDRRFKKYYGKRGYIGYEIDKKGGLIVFKTGYPDSKPDENVYFDPYTLMIHLQNDLWLDEFNSDLLLGMINDLECLVSTYNLRVAENIKEKWGFGHE